MKTIVTSILLIAVSLVARGASFNSNPTADAFVSTGPSGNLSGNNSRTFGTAASRPLLTIVAVPEPGTFALGGLGLVLLGGWRWALGRK